MTKLAETPTADDLLRSLLWKQGFKPWDMKCKNNGSRGRGRPRGMWTNNIKDWTKLKYKYCIRATLDWERMEIHCSQLADNRWHMKKKKDGRVLSEIIKENGLLPLPAHHRGWMTSFGLRRYEMLLPKIVLQIRIAQESGYYFIWRRM